jgi:hypothetical protein
VVQQADGIPRDQSTERVSNDGDPLDVMALPCQFLQLLFYLTGDTFATRFDAIVGEAPRIALRDEDVELIVGVPVFDGLSQVLEVDWIAPETTCTVSVPDKATTGALKYSIRPESSSQGPGDGTLAVPFERVAYP